MDAKLLRKLAQREADNTLRSLTQKSGGIDLFSNDYLGIARDLDFSVTAKGGSTGSRLLSGNSIEANTCEDTLARFFQVESALVFNSGYAANVGVFSSLPQRGDTILYDESVHASIRDGIRLSFAKAISFAHNDVEDLQQKIKKAEGTVYIAVESLYSMDGDKGALNEIVAIASTYHAYLIVDEAHAVGVYGQNGRGLVDELGLESETFIRIVTFGKAWGFHGAAILASENVKKYLVNFARSFIYTTALPPSDYATLTHICKTSNWFERQQQLQDNIHYFRSKSTLNLVSASDSPIQILNFPKEKLLAIVSKLSSVAITTKAIFPPTVPEGKECIRLCLHSFNTQKEIDVLWEGLR